MDDDFVFVPPRRIFADDILVDDVEPGGLGRNVPFWKVLLWRTAQVRARARADAASVTPVRDEDLPSRLVTDAEPDLAEGLREEFQLHTLLAKIARFEQRIEALEKRKKANDLLLALEAAEPPEESSPERTLN
jgi:hypothetical protein